MNVLKSIVIILWAITGTVNLIQGNIDRWEYLIVRVETEMWAAEWDEARQRILRARR